MSVVGVIVVLFVVFLCFGFRSPLSPLLCLITVFLIILFHYDVEWMRQRKPMRPSYICKMTDASELRVRFPVNKTGLSPHKFSTDCSKEILLLQFFFVCSSLVSYVAFVLSLFVLHLSLFWCLGRAVLHGCGISWVSSNIRLTNPWI